MRVDFLDVWEPGSQNPEQSDTFILDPVLGLCRERAELLMRGGELPLFQPLWLGCLTATAALMILFLAADRLDRDEIVYGN